jgi:hypothetical protein
MDTAISRQGRCALWAVAVIIATAGSPAFADTELAKLTASDGAAGDRLGRYVALQGQTALVGASWDQDTGFESGSVYVFEQVEGIWLEQDKLRAADTVEDDEFGHAIALSGDWAVIGAPGVDEPGVGVDVGAVYFYHYEGGSWVEHSKHFPSDGEVGDFFTFAGIALEGDLAVIGSVHDDDAGASSGSAYVFRNVEGTWVEEAKLTASDAAASARLGFQVDISNGKVVVGAPRDAEDGFEAGAAYVFEQIEGTWTEVAKLTADDGAASAFFGYTVAMENDTIVVGAYGRDDVGTDSGGAYIFHYDGLNWTQAQKLDYPELAAYDRFGYAVDIQGGKVLVSSLWGLGAGSRYGHRASVRVRWHDVGAVAFLPGERRIRL